MSNNQTVRKPSHRLYIVTGEGDKTFWQEVGAAWPNQDGQGFSITVTAIPLQGRVVMRAITGKATKGGR